MGRTARRVLGTGSIAVLLALTAATAGAAPAATDAIKQPPSPPHASPPAEGLVDPLRESDGESLEAPRERASTLRLDHHVHVVALHREVENPESAS